MTGIDKHSPGYFSHWSYSTFAECPYKYFLYFIEKKRPDPASVDRGYDAKGSIAHILAENFFKLPPKDRVINFFFDEFDRTFDDFVSNHYINESVHNIGEIRGETDRCVKNMARIILSNNLVQADAEAEVEFATRVDEKICVGGRIDLIIHLDRERKIVDVWDWKAGRNSPLEQLYFYGWGVQSFGWETRRTGFFLLREGRVRNSRLLPAGYNKLLSALYDARSRIERGAFPPSFNFLCRRCDVQAVCDHYLREAEEMEAVRNLPRGRVEF